MLLSSFVANSDIKNCTVGTILGKLQTYGFGIRPNLKLTKQFLEQNVQLKRKVQIPATITTVKIQCKNDTSPNSKEFNPTYQRSFSFIKINLTYLEALKGLKDLNKAIKIPGIT